jgi:hypothetical protein
MAIKLPNLSAAGALRLIVCARVKRPGKIVQESLKQRRSLIFTYSVSGRNFFGRLITGGFPGHFHVECASPESFAEASKPKPNSTVQEFQAIADPVVGCDAGAQARCFFEVPISDLSKTGVIRTLSAETTAAGVSVKLTAGTLAFSGSPIDRVEWKIQADDSIRIGLESVSSVKITENYLDDLLNETRSLFDVIILGKETKSNV